MALQVPPSFSTDDHFLKPPTSFYQPLCGAQQPILHDMDSYAHTIMDPSATRTHRKRLDRSAVLRHNLARRIAIENNKVTRETEAGVETDDEPRDASNTRRDTESSDSEDEKKKSSSPQASAAAPATVGGANGANAAQVNSAPQIEDGSHHFQHRPLAPGTIAGIVLGKSAHIRCIPPQRRLKGDSNERKQDPLPWPASWHSSYGGESSTAEVSKPKSNANTT